MENKETRTTGSLAVITGASSGIGFELAKVFAENGYDLMIVAENQEIETAAKNLDSYSVQVTPIVADLATRAGVDQLYLQIQQHSRPVDVLCVNAGVGSGGEFVSTDLEKEVNLICLNVLSPVILTKKVLKDMVARGSGKILFTSSIAAETPGPYEAVYAASKAFVQSFAIAIRHEVKDKGVVVTSLQPGATETDFFARADMLDTKVGQAEKDDPAKVARQGYEALMAGKDSIVAGSVMNKVEVAAAKFMSDQAGAKRQADSTKPRSVH